MRRSLAMDTLSNCNNDDVDATPLTMEREDVPSCGKPDHPGLHVHESSPFSDFVKASNVVDIPPPVATERRGAKSRKQKLRRTDYRSYSGVRISQLSEAAYHLLLNLGASNDDICMDLQKILDAKNTRSLTRPQLEEFTVCANAALLHLYESDQYEACRELAIEYLTKGVTVANNLYVPNRRDSIELSNALRFMILNKETPYAVANILSSTFNEVADSVSLTSWCRLGLGSMLKHAKQNPDEFPEIDLKSFLAIAIPEGLSAAASSNNPVTHAVNIGRAKTVMDAYTRRIGIRIDQFSDDALHFLQSLDLPGYCFGSGVDFLDIKRSPISRQRLGEIAVCGSAAVLYLAKHNPYECTEFVLGFLNRCARIRLLLHNGRHTYPEWTALREEFKFFLLNRETPLLAVQMFKRAIDEARDSISNVGQLGIVRMLNHATTFPRALNAFPDQGWLDFLSATSPGNPQLARIAAATQQRR